jgi:hypothetical protein
MAAYESDRVKCLRQSEGAINYCKKAPGSVGENYNRYQRNSASVDVDAFECLMQW